MSTHSKDLSPSFEEEDEEQELLPYSYLRELNQTIPIVWLRLGGGIRIQDLKAPYFDDVIELFKDYYISEDVLCKSTEMELDGESVKSFLTQLHNNLKAETSIVVINETLSLTEEYDEIYDNDFMIEEEPKEKIIASLVMRIVQKNNFGRVMSTPNLVDGDAITKIVKLKRHLESRNDFYIQYNCDEFLRFYAICITPEYRETGLGLHLLQCGVRMARSRKIPLILGTFADTALQNLGRRIGMEVVNEVKFSEWVEYENEIIFENTGINETCALMIHEVYIPPPPPPPPLPEPPTKGKKKGKK